MTTLEAPSGKASRASDGPGRRRRVASRIEARVPEVGPDALVVEARALLAAGRFSYAGHLAVLDGDHLVGLVPIESLSAASPGDRVAGLVDPGVPRAAPDDFEEAAAADVARRGSRVLAVVDVDHRFLGVLPPEALLLALVTEHEEDVARFGGSLARTAQVRSALEERVVRRLWHRTPWLVLGLLGAMFSTVLTASFEDALATRVVLAFFVPAVVYLADAVGTQTEALVIRGISQGVSLRAILVSELATGLLIGLVLAGLFLPFAFMVGGDLRLAFAISLALVVSCATATLVALGLPYVFAKFGKDPAFGSGPLATVIQDLLSLAVYFALAISVGGV
ncbi:magnesium transporter [Nocardioides sp. Root151]|uniref:magnesium transporter n=1 Tax=Nocardioides sp. Root151 TaxID=1736475 RepID=UPI000702AF7C|nr:magnesium transporter [Nocardioides sp. Root151]KQZ70356.1 hypothetical protein ASD66_12055 [Nocardioides sp. Root151]